MTVPTASSATVRAAVPERGVTDRLRAALAVGEVTKAFSSGPPWHRRRIEVLRGASLEVRPGERVGLVGENGSGKSTLMQVIVGLIARDGGSVARPGRLGYCPQQPLLWEKLTVAEHFELFARAYRLDDQVASDSRDRLLAELRFTKYLGYLVRLLDLSREELERFRAAARRHDRSSLPGAVRASAGISTTQSDLARFLDAVRFIASTPPPVEYARDPWSGDYWPAAMVRPFGALGAGAGCGRG